MRTKIKAQWKEISLKIREMHSNRKKMKKLNSRSIKIQKLRSRRRRSKILNWQKSISISELLAINHISQARKALTRGCCDSNE